MRQLLQLTFLLSIVSIFSCRQSTPTMEIFKETKRTLSPDERYGELFKAIQLGDVFPDSKTFTDCTPKFTTDEILQKYTKTKSEAGFDIKTFVKENFELPHKYASGFKSDTTRSAIEHINSLWDVLKREPDASTNGTLIPLPESYIVPGGRFGEIYYWDSYFTILGLQSAQKIDMVENMTDNFSYIIDTLGYIPNGNRTYFIGRSQPPFYASIVQVLAEEKGAGTLVKYLPQLEKEYLFWMDGKDKLTDEKPTHRRVVKLDDGSILNRYWDDRPVPRPESYREDVELAKGVNRPATEVYRHIRAACESGWDFSSRWFDDGQYLATIRTADIIPVDLNSLLYNLEMTLAAAYKEKGDEEKMKTLTQNAEQRKAAIYKYAWSEKEGYFMDYNFIDRKHTQIPSLAGMFPLFFNIADQQQADATKMKIEKDFLKPGGVVTTLNKTGQQWDSPNGWAPLQWITIQGLRNYNQKELANTIKQRWTDLNVRVYKTTGKMVEKYNVLDITLEAGGGEYPVQDGFGWTNGVLLKLLSEPEPIKD